MDLSPDHLWEPICPVDIAPLAAWLNDLPAIWPQQAYASKPQRRFDLPNAIIHPITETILAHFPANSCVQELVLSRMMPDQWHDYHVDQQPTAWLTRVHVPIITNPEAWIGFERQPGPRHLKEGLAYTFNTLQRHAFGNPGVTPRVHLIFDVFRG